MWVSRGTKPVSLPHIRLGEHIYQPKHTHTHTHTNTSQPAYASTAHLWCDELNADRAQLEDAQRSRCSGWEWVLHDMEQAQCLEQVNSCTRKQRVGPSLCTCAHTLPRKRVQQEAPNTNTKYTCDTGQTRNKLLANSLAAGAVALPHGAHKQLILLRVQDLDPVLVKAG